MNDDRLALLSPVWTRLSGIVVERAEGIYLYDGAGNRYVDFTSGIGVTGTGHCHPTVVRAVQEQAARLIFGQVNCMLAPATLELAEALRPLMPEGLDCFFFSNSGAEAVEAAVKLARAATGRPNVIAFEGGFHGRTALAMALTGSKTVYRAGYQPLPSGVFFAPFPYAYQYGWAEKEAIDFCLERLDFILHSRTAPEETAAVLIEPVLGEGGYVPTPPRFLTALRELCDRHGLLLIVDEIQSGFGRTGLFWAHTRSGIKPDILVMAKGIASGMPLSAIAAPRALMERWHPGSHGGTYGGGNAVVMAAAVATLRVLEEEGLVRNALRMGLHLMKRLRGVQQRFPLLGDVRGWGLMVGTEFTRAGKPAPDVAKAVARACLERRLLLLTCGTYGNVVRWIPPLIVTKEQIDQAVDVFEDALGSVVNSSMG